MRKALLFCLMVFQGQIYSLNAQEQAATSIQNTPVNQTVSKQLPKIVSVQIVNATIGPCKVDGSKWSGMGKVNPSVTTQLTQLLVKASAYTSIIGFLGSSAISSLGKPEPYGSVEVAIGGQYVSKLQARLVNTAKALERTYTPIFYLPAYQNVPFEEGTRFKVTLYSKNYLNPKPTPIGVAIINYNDLLKALQEEKIYQVPVGDQTQNQLLFIGIEVNAVTSSPNN